MTMVPVMWLVWGVLALFAAAVLLYRSNIERNEENQVFLDDSFDHERTAQAAIVAKVNRVQPLVRAALWLLAIATTFVVGYYLMDFVRQLR